MAGMWPGGAQHGTQACGYAPPVQVSTTYEQSRAQHLYMTEIVRGMQAGDIGAVASALSGAVRARASLPDDFLATVKQWMDSRSQSAQASMQMARMFTPPPQQQQGSPPAAAPAASQAPMGAQGFRHLEQQLEDAISRRDVNAQFAVLQHAAQLAAGGSMQASGTPGAGAPGSACPPAGMSAGYRQAGGGPPTMAQQAGAVPHYQPAAVPPSAQGVGPQVVAPRLSQPAQGQVVPPLPVGQPPPAPVEQPPPFPSQTRAPQRSGAPSPEFSPTCIPSEEEGLDLPQPVPGDEARGLTLPVAGTAPRRRPDESQRPRSRPPSSAARLLGSLDSSAAAKIASVSVDRVRTPPADDFAGGGDTSPAMDDHFSPGFAPMPDETTDAFVPGGGADRAITVNDVVDFLRTQDGDAATYRKLGLHFRNSESVRGVVEMTPTMFNVRGDRVFLKDQQKKDMLAHFAKELCHRVFTKRRIRADEALEAIHKAANVALQAYPEDVSRLLKELSRCVLRRPGIVGKGRYSASMPLALACMVDRIVMLERQRAGPPKFENALGPVVHKIIFRRWVLGVTPGSNFLANLLLVWERLGYFKAKHLQEPIKTMWLLVAYGRADGVADGSEKDPSTNWYRVVAREPGTEGCEPITNRQGNILPPKKDIRPIQEEPTAKRPRVDGDFGAAPGDSAPVILPTETQVGTDSADTPAPLLAGS
eukprot:TRINITY_DN62922_c0_g1_i1.p1 TRINITY_DN62922_c0_g1~~TRINITY_DN62922_c0_g1_i1.p1  ORF type:complete len:703 (-),score=111.09 TRINITY_DN62922_c0_g1_i1:49-2157(-)